MNWDEAPREGEDHGLIDHSDLPFLGDSCATQLRVAARWQRLTIQAMIEAAVDLYLSVPPDDLDEVQGYIRDLQADKNSAARGRKVRKSA